MAQLLKRIVVAQRPNVLIEDLGPSGVFLRRTNDARDLLSQFVDGKNKSKFTLEQICSSRSLDNLIKRGHLKLYDESGNELDNAAGGSAEKSTNLATLKDIDDALSGGGVSNFLSLTDTPSSYSGYGGDGIRVKGTEDGLEFYTTSNTDEKVAVDAIATPGYLGNSSSDGVLRTSSPLTYSDGGDFITIGLDQSLISINSTQIADFSESVDDRINNLLIEGSGISISYNDSGNELTISVNQSELDHTNLLNIGTYTHSQIDTHINSTSNPHSTSDANLVVTDVTTNNATASAHGFLPKLSGTSTEFLNGNGSWDTPCRLLSQSFTGQTSVNIIHNFGKEPLVQVIVSGEVYIPLSIVHNTINDFTINFSNSTSGTILYVTAV